MTANTYPTIDTIRFTSNGLECRYCGQGVNEHHTGYRHRRTGQDRCDPSTRLSHENRLSDSLIRR
ncbi:hypothetical protein [Rhodococcus jostii]|uniref:hypothetical protein n=1 Tax=Rhodococcus jostii TaxID=132919 RepID=UPI00363A85FF